MPSRKNKSDKSSPAEHAIVNFFLQDAGRFYSFKQLKKKFSNRFDKNEIYDAVQHLSGTGFLIFRGTQFRHVPGEPAGETNQEQKDIVEGTVDMTSGGNGYVISPQSEKDIWVEKRNLGTAFDGDLVKVLLINKKKKKPEGKVIEVIQRARDTFIGTVREYGNQLFFVPEQKGLDIDFLIPSPPAETPPFGNKVVARMISWEPGTRYPLAEISKVLGKAGANETEMQAILIENGFRLEFPAAVMKETSALPDEIPPEEIEKRRDFRGVLTFTIDPEDAKDFDDAISYKELGNGLYEIGVHIADVTHYIQEKTELDKEALLRATSVYLVDRTVPMLPEKLSNGICSLTPENDKLCFSAVFMMTENGDVKEEWFGKTIIHSNRRFSYEQAQEILEGKKDKFSAALLKLNGIAKKLREQRFKNGAINFETVEVKFRLDEQARPLNVFVKERKDAHMLIEDFMLLANRKVATFVGKRKGREIPFVYRIHDLPDDEKLKNFAELAYMFGYKLNFSTPRHTALSFNKMMVQLQGKPEQYMLETLGIRTMAKAIYSTKNIGHYGLAFDFYTHFTSPIRRYPDMMVHRILEKVLLDEKVKEPNLEARCNYCSGMEKKAAEAERTSVKLKQVEFMEGKIGEIFDGIISGVAEWGIFVMTEGSYCEGLVRLDSIEGDYFVYDEKKHAVKGLRTARKYQLGDKVKVKLINTNAGKRTIDFVLAQ